MLKKGLIILIVLLGIIVLFGCIDDEDIDKGKDTPIDNIIDNSFFDFDSLNYNNEYSNPADQTQKGFLLYDAINFNHISFDRTYSKSPRFEIYYDNQFLKTIEKSPNGTVFPSYTLDKTGIYTIKVLVYTGTGNNLQGEFDIYVKAGGYPDEIITEITDLEGNPVSEVMAGHQYQLHAEVYSDGELLPEDTILFSSKWSDGQIGERMNQITIPNQKEDTEINYCFYYECFLENYSTTERTFLKIDVKNNYEGIELDYGPYLKSKDVTMDITEIFSPPSAMVSPFSFMSTMQDDVEAEESSTQQGIKTNFIQYVSAYHKFNNGDVEEIPVNYSDTNQFYSIVAFIRYDDEVDFHRYIQGIYNFDTQSNNYINNDTVYQFHPKRNMAELYFAYCNKEDFDGGSRYVYNEIENSRFNISLRKNAPENISIDYISGREKTNEKITKFVSFDRREVVDDTVEVKIAVENGVNISDINKNQYFRLNVIMDRKAKARDYTITTEPFGYLNYNYKENYFNPLKEGEAFINIKPVACDIVYRLTVKIVNPIIEYELIKNSRYEIPEAFIGGLDIMPYLQIKEFYYNNTFRIKNELDENQTIKYFVKNEEKTQEYFVPLDEKYRDIQILFYDESRPNISQKGITLSFYILPDFAIIIDGEKYILSQIETVDSITEIIDEDGNTENIIMNTPKLQINSGNENSIIFIEDLYGNNIPKEEVCLEYCKIKPSQTLCEIYYFHRMWNVKIMSITLKI